MQKLITKTKDFAKSALAYVKTFPARIVNGFKAVEYKTVFRDMIGELKSAGVSLAIIALGTLLIVSSPFLILFAAFLPRVATRVMGYALSKL